VGGSPRNDGRTGGYKTAHVIEEVVVGKLATERTETIDDTVRHLVVLVYR
jgi:stress response protein YsnF